MPSLSALLQESAPPTVTDDDTGWVSINRPTSLVSPLKIDQAIIQSKKGFYTNSVLHLLIDTQVDFIVGDPLIPYCPNNEAASQWLRQYWESEVNNDLEFWARELVCVGENLVIVDRSAPWAPEVISTDPGLILSFETPQDNPRRLAKVVLGYPGGEQSEVLPLFRYSQPSDPRVAAFLAINRFGDDLRGSPPQMHLLDSANVFDRANISMLSRLPALYAIWWDVTLKGYTPDQIRAWDQEYGGSIPQPGSILAHNDSSEWEVKSASGAARTSADWYAYFRDFLLTSGGVSPSLFTGMSYRNSEANNPTFRAIGRVKKQFVNFLTQVAILALQATPYKQEKVVIDYPDPRPADSSRLATTLQRYVSSVLGALNAEVLDREEARDLLMTPFQKGKEVV